MQDFMAKLNKKVWFPDVILKYMKKIRFQYLTFDIPFFKVDNCLLFMQNRISIFGSGHWVRFVGDAED